MRKWVSLPSPKEDTSTIYALENDALDYTTFMKAILKASADSEDKLPQNPLQNAVLHRRGVVQEIQETVIPRGCAHTYRRAPESWGPNWVALASECGQPGLHGLQVLFIFLIISLFWGSHRSWRFGLRKGVSYFTGRLAQGSWRESEELRTHHVRTVPRSSQPPLVPGPRTEAVELLSEWEFASSDNAHHSWEQELCRWTDGLVMLPLRDPASDSQVATTTGVIHIHPKS